MTCVPGFMIYNIVFVKLCNFVVFQVKTIGQYLVAPIYL